MRRRQFKRSAKACLSAALAFSLVACAAQKGPAPGPSSFGGAAADEPRAATVARDVLIAGGSAADGAVAAFFAMTATFPSAVSLAGGGLCVVHRPDPEKSELLEFPVGAPSRGGAIGVPAAVPAMAALHARYGKLRWEQVLSPGEQLARFGHPMSRATAHAVRATSFGLLETAAAIYGGPDGKVLEEGQTFGNPALGASIGRLRTVGAYEIQRGQLARALADDIAEAGGGVSDAELRAVAPSWMQPKAIEFGFSKLLLPGNVSGQVFTELWTSLVREPGFWRGAAVERTNFLDAIGRANQRFGPSPPIGSDNGAGLVVADRNGLTVACGFTMGRPFGAARYGKATGIMLASAPAGAMDPQALLLPIVGISPNIKQVFLGAAATGGALAASAAFETVANLVAGGARAPEALAAPRVFWSGPGGILLYEGGTAPAILADARARGLDAVQMQAIGLVDLMHCTEALPRVPESCGLRADPRGFGLGAGGGF